MIYWASALRFKIRNPSLKRIFRFVFSANIAFLMSLGSLSAQSAISIDTARSTVTFRIKNADIWANGKFEKISSRIYFDISNPANTRFSSIIYVNSIKTGIRLRDMHLKRPIYFDVEKYPTIQIELVGAKLLSRGKYEGIFSVRIKDVEKRLTIPFTQKKDGQSSVFDAEFKVNRRDFNVGGRSWTLSDNVDVKVSFSVKNGNP